MGYSGYIRSKSTTGSQFKLKLEGTATHRGCSAAGGKAILAVFVNGRDTRARSATRCSIKLVLERTPAGAEAVSVSAIFPYTTHRDAAFYQKPGRAESLFSSAVFVAQGVGLLLTLTLRWIGVPLPTLSFLEDLMRALKLLWRLLAVSLASIVVGLGGGL